MAVTRRQLRAAKRVDVLEAQVVTGSADADSAPDIPSTDRLDERAGTNGIRSMADRRETERHFSIPGIERRKLVRGRRVLAETDGDPGVRQHVRRGLVRLRFLRTRGRRICEQNCRDDRAPPNICHRWSVVHAATASCELATP